MISITICRRNVWTSYLIAPAIPTTMAYSAAHALRCRLDRFLAAPVPVWCTHTPNQTREGECPMEVERKFTSRHGDTIRPIYLKTYEQCLQALCSWIVSDCKDSDFFLEMGSICRFAVRYEVGDAPGLYLDSIMVRPCAIGLGIFQQVMYVLHCNAVALGIRLGCDDQLFPVKEELEKISSEFEEETYYWYLPPDKLGSAKFSLENRVEAARALDSGPFVVSLDTGAWPSADELNSQTKVDSRSPENTYV